ncbi:hypothetical protein [Dysgonomonas mossii]|uniref:hypothetical protein n=1 Tax=Dysgonomonas mossii TaxID=163665 RepID=UPI00399580F2
MKNTCALNINFRKKENIGSIAELLKVSPQYVIELIIEDNNDGYTNLLIKNKGTRISRKDLKYLSSTGSSLKNIERKSRITQIPEWMQPVGFLALDSKVLFY